MDALNPATAPVEILEYSPHRIQMRATAPRDCWLFLSDTWYPGWRATVDGRETHIHRANIAGRAIRMPQGSHRIEFEYAPASFRNGVYLALFGLLLLVTMGFWRNRSTCRSRPATA